MTWSSTTCGAWPGILGVDDDLRVGEIGDGVERDLGVAARERGRLAGRALGRHRPDGGRGRARHVRRPSPRRRSRSRPGGSAPTRRPRPPRWSPSAPIPGPALAAAVAAHALKTAYSLAAGAVAVVRPAPGLLRPAPAAAGRAAARPSVPRPTAPVVLFLPAHDEEATVAAVVAPRARRPCSAVRFAASSSTTARPTAPPRAAPRLRAPRCVSLRAQPRPRRRRACGPRRGRRARRRRGGVLRRRRRVRAGGARAAGRADPRRRGRLRRRARASPAGRAACARTGRLGNLVLTGARPLVARRRITDGQSGYRALRRARRPTPRSSTTSTTRRCSRSTCSPRATATPRCRSRYRFRTEGRSFVRLGRYLRARRPGSASRSCNGEPA